MPLLLNLYQQAEAGDPYAIYQLAYRYATGTGVYKDRAEAKRWYSKLTDASVVTLAQAHPKLTHFELHGCEQITDAAILELVEQCPGLTYIGLKGCKGITQDSVTAIADRCTELRHIDLSDTLLGKDAIPPLLQILPKCTTVALGNCSDIPADSWIKIASKLSSKLTVLDLSRAPVSEKVARELTGKLRECTNVTLDYCSNNADIWSLIYEGLSPNVECLSLAGCYLKDETAVSLLCSKVGNCRVLLFADAKTTFKRLQRIIQALPARVVSLDVSGLSLKGGVQEPLKARLRDCVTFRARGCKLASTKSWANILGALPDNVEELDLSETTVTAADMKSIAGKLRHCRKLHLTGPNTPRPGDLQPIQEVLPPGADYVTEQDPLVAALAGLTTGLQRLQGALPSDTGGATTQASEAMPSPNTQLSPLSALAIANQYFGLTELDLRTVLIDDTCVPFLMRLLPICTTVKLGNCANITPDGWAQLVDSLSNSLTTLALSDALLQDTHAQSLAAKLEQCTDLTLNNCKKLTPNGWGFIYGRISPRIERLSLNGAHLRRDHARNVLGPKIKNCLELSLADCITGPPALIKLFEHLSEDIRVLDVSGLSLGNAWGLRLPKRLKNCVVLKARGCKIRDTTQSGRGRSWATVINALPDTLQEIDLSETDLSSTELTALVPKLRHCRKIRLTGLRMTPALIRKRLGKLPPETELEV